MILFYLLYKFKEENRHSLLKDNSLQKCILSYHENIVLFKINYRIFLYFFTCYLFKLTPSKVQVQINKYVYKYKLLN